MGDTDNRHTIPEQHPDYVFAAMREANRDQPPIEFGGVRLSELRKPVKDREIPELPPVTWKGAVGTAPGLQPFPGPTDDGKHLVRRTDQGNVQVGPAGEGSPEARLVTISRWAMAARIRHGVPLADLLGHFQTLALVEANLMSYKEVT